MRRKKTKKTKVKLGTVKNSKELEYLRLIRRKSKAKVTYETARLPYMLRKNYRPDYILNFPDGRVRYIELKGWLRPSDRTKMRAVKELNPDLDIRIVFLANNKLNKDSTTRYSDWAEQHGFPWAIKEVPKEWLV